MERGNRLAEFGQSRCAAPAHVDVLARDRSSARVIALATPEFGFPLGNPRMGDASGAAVVEVEGVAALLAAALAGCGVAILPDFAAAPHLADGSLVRLESSDLPRIVLRAEVARNAAPDLSADLLASLRRHGAAVR